MGFEGGPLLSLVIFLPLLGAVVVLFLPRGEGGLHKGTALVTSIVTFLFSIPTASASNASCGLRPGRKPYEKPRKSAS